MSAGEIKKAAREARNGYYRAWRKRNPEKVREYNERYWAKRMQKAMENSNKEEQNY